ncbi:MFS transporter [Novosphingobium sp.]|uniref:MFS transporter n=1 Tax=Novosphingobium sp. TaxID=1874826 RepID=UPI002FDDEEED
MSTQAAYPFSREEAPLFPGAPWSPRHTPLNRAIYALSAFVMAMASGFGNGLITANLAFTAGDIGLTVAEGSLLLAVYVAFNATANLTLVKARVQFGIPATMHVVLGALIAAQLVQIAVPCFATAIVARAVSGVAAGGLSTLSLYNMFQVFPLRMRPVAAILGFCLPQLAIPLARMVPLSIISMHEWQGLHLIELALAIGAWGMLNLMPLPPNSPARAFEPLDVVTVALIIVAMLLVCTVMAVGRYDWWTDTPWLGWALAAALPLIGAALMIEDRRQSPLLWVRWFATRDVLFFIAVAVIIRLALAEQTYAAVGLLSLGGLTSDQLHGLFLGVLLAEIAGIVVVCIFSKPHQVVPLMSIAAFVIAFGAWLDTHSTSLTRAPELLLSQSLLGFGTILFLGPALMFGIGQIIKRGPTHLVSFIVLFSTTQNLGGLAGSAALGTFQTMRARTHAQYLADAVSLGDPLVTQRLAQYAGRLAPQLVDPALRDRQALGQLSQALNAQASVLAFNDTFWVVTVVALTAGILTAAYALREKVQRDRLQRSSESVPA